MIALGAIMLWGVPTAARADGMAACVDAAESAQRFTRAAKLVEARGQLLTCIDAACPAAVRDDCTKWLAALDPRIPSIVVRAREGTTELRDVRVAVDGKPLLDRLDGTSKPINPGDHEVVATLADGRTMTQRFLVAESEQSQTLRLDFPLSRPKATTAPPMAPKNTGPGLAPWVLVGVGGAALVGFGVLETLAQVRYADLKNGCGVAPPGATAGTCNPDDVSSVRGMFIGSLVLLGAGVVAAGSGAAWLAFGKRSSARVDVSATSTGAFLVYSGSLR